MTVVIDRHGRREIPDINRRKNFESFENEIMHRLYNISLRLEAKRMRHEIQEGSDESRVLKAIVPFLEEWTREERGLKETLFILECDEFNGEKYLQEAADEIYRAIKDFVETEHPAELDALSFSVNTILDTQKPAPVPAVVIEELAEEVHTSVFESVEAATRHIAELVQKIEAFSERVSTATRMNNGNLEVFREMIGEELFQIQEEIRSISEDARNTSQYASDLEGVLRLSVEDLFERTIPVAELEGVSEHTIIDEAVGMAEEIIPFTSLDKYIEESILPALGRLKDHLRQMRETEVIQKRELLAQKEIITKLSAILFVIVHSGRVGFAIDSKDRVRNLLFEAVKVYNEALERSGKSFQSLKALDFNILIDDVEQRKALTAPQIVGGISPHPLAAELDRAMTTSQRQLNDIHTALAELGIPVPELDNESQ